MSEDVIQPEARGMWGGTTFPERSATRRLPRSERLVALAEIALSMAPEALTPAERRQPTGHCAWA